MRRMVLLCGFLGLVCAAHGMVVRIPLPELTGSYPPGKTAAFDLSSFGQIRSVRFGCSGSITPGLGCGDGVELPVYSYFEWPAQLEAYIDCDPGFWTAFIGPYDRSFVIEEPFDEHFGADWDSLPDGQGELQVSLVSAVIIGGCMLEPPQATVTDAYILVDGGRADNLAVVSPNGGEFIPEYYDWTVRWNDGPVGGVCVGSYIVEYSDDGGANWTAMTESRLYQQCSYLWRVPRADSNQCLVRVVDVNDPNIADGSNDVFTIYNCMRNDDMDLDEDCYVDFRDFSILAAEWLAPNGTDMNDLVRLLDEWCLCGNPYDAGCTP